MDYSGKVCGPDEDVCRVKQQHPFYNKKTSAEESPVLSEVCIAAAAPAKEKEWQVAAKESKSCTDCVNRAPLSVLLPLLQPLQKV